MFTALGEDVLTVQYGLSYFSPAHHEVRAACVHHGMVNSSTPHQIFHFYQRHLILRHCSGRPQLQEEVEMDGRVVGRKGKMAAVTVEVRKKESGELVATCRQWMAPLGTTKRNTSSKL